MIDLNKITGFNWDDGNARKNEKHGVSMAEAEQTFFNAPLLLLQDNAHSQTEARFHALGKTDDGRTLHITFALRQSGLFDQLEQMGIQDGDIVSMYDLEFEYQR